MTARKRKVKARVSDTELLNWLIKIINYSGSRSIEDVVWTCREWRGEDSSIFFDRPTIKRMIKKHTAAKPARR